MDAKILCLQLQVHTYDTTVMNIARSRSSCDHWFYHFIYDRLNVFNINMAIAQCMNIFPAKRNIDIIER